MRWRHRRDAQHGGLLRTVAEATCSAGTEHAVRTATRTLMRTEIENAVAEIRQGITLLRRHL